jgi:hypothetical protein
LIVGRPTEENAPDDERGEEEQDAERLHDGVARSEKERGLVERLGKRIQDMGKHDLPHFELVGLVVGDKGVPGFRRGPVPLAESMLS